MIAYSVVIPIKDEAENILPLMNELAPVMNSLGQPWELIYIDDGSTDCSLPQLQKLALAFPDIRVIVFERNFGQSSAFDAGFKAARGEFVITLDGDGQNDPKDIPALIAEADSHDLVCGWRVNRRDPLSKKIISKLANGVRGRLCHDYTHDTGCSLKVYRTACLRQIKMYQGMHRFLPALFRMEGFRVTEVAVSHRERTRGQSKYHFFNRSLGPLVDLFGMVWLRRRTLRYRIKEVDHG